jgi:D-serine deaminase-like pyridoxal phosphate-dependent protein
LTVDYMPLPGTPLEEIDTPALVVDLDAAEANIKALQDWCDANGVNARPHVKTHKSPYWARKQIAAGAIGVCAAKVGEAEAMVAGGVTDILIANQIVGPIKIPRLAALAHQATIRVVVDDANNVRDLSNEASRAGVEIGVLVDINVRIDRTGVEPGEPAIDLARSVADAPGLRFDGLMGYEGHVTPEEQAQTDAVETWLGKLQAAIIAVEEAGYPVEVVSGAGTTTYRASGSHERVTEVQCGTYIFMDGAYGPEAPEFTTALTVISQVMSRPVPERAVIDIGLKSVSVDSGPPVVFDRPGAEISRMAEEHGILSLEDEARNLKVGDRVRLLPMHGDTTINQHSHYFGVRNGILEDVIPITARGRFR